MTTTAAFLRYSLLVALLLIQMSCDRPPQPTSQPKEPVWTSESIELSLDSLIDSAVDIDKKAVEEAHKSGHSNVVGGRDGNWWLGSNALMRVTYVNAVGDLVGALGNINGAASVEMENQKRLKTLDYEFESDSFHGGADAESRFSGRIQEVMGGHSFGDLADAITKFYQNKPLMKDRPVLWVLAGPLYKELQEAKPPEKKVAHETISIQMRKKAQQ